MVSTYPYTNLVFEGGGVKGVACCGALEVLEQAGVLGQLTAVAGTSAGAITATLVALGYSSAELRETMLDLNFRRFEAMHVDFFQRSHTDLERTVIIDDLGILATDFDVTREQKLELIAKGAAATRRFLDARTPAPALPAEPS